MRAAIYARYSSDNQRPESIKDQVSACRRLAKAKGYTIVEDHIYADEALSGARSDRPSLEAMIVAAREKHFDLVLVDDLSRLARNNQLLLTVLEELLYNGVKVISVADGVDSGDEEATFIIQLRGAFNELQLQDLKKKTLRGQIGQKERGFFVGEKTYGFRSVPSGEVTMDKKGRPRPEGYKMEINAEQAAVVLRVFQEFADGASQTSIIKTLNEEGVPGPYLKDKKWSPGTIHRMLTNEKYRGEWIWNRQGTRRDPRTGRRRRYTKPESEWQIYTYKDLRIVPEEIWQKVQERKEATRKTWPGGKGKRGFSGQRGSKEQHYPTHLLSGSMQCAVCGGTIVQVSGKSGGYYGCHKASRGACDNKRLVPRKRAEKIIVGAVSKQLEDAEHLRYILKRVEKEVGKLRKDLPEAMKLKEAELTTAERRLENFIEAIGDGRGSKALSEALVETERRAETLREEVEGLRASREGIFKAPPVDWIQERLLELQGVLEARTEKSALLLRDLLGPIRLEPITEETEKPFYRAKTSLNTLALIEKPLDEDSGSSGLQQWRRPELNRRPRP